MFMDESISIESLRTLEFTYKQPKLKPRKKAKKITRSLHVGA